MINRSELSRVMAFLGQKTSALKKRTSALNGCRGGRPAHMWKDVSGFEGIYRVSSTGCLERVGNPGVRLGHKDPKGYWRVHLRRGGRQLKWPLHRLVLETFIGAMPNGYEVNHKDGNKNNNRLTNLEYVTHVNNLKHAHKHGLINSKNKCYNAHLTAAQVLAIRTAYRERKEPYRVIGARYQVSKWCIKEIINNKTWKTQ